MREVVLAAVQMACDDDRAVNLDRAEAFVRQAADRGAQLVLLPELFETRYFCQDQDAAFLDRASPLVGNATIARFASLARALGVVLPLSLFERAGQCFFNTLVMIDADGSVLGHYRKSHIPDGPGYTEKFYFSPGDTGFRVWRTQFGDIGAGICWDQWFPEAARCMALMGAEILLYPTAIGSEPQDPDLDSAGHWRRVMQGHAGANLMPVVAANRVGREPGLHGTSIRFYGTSFIAGPTGEINAEIADDSEGIAIARHDLDALRARRQSWGVFRDRRPDLYGALATLDGRHPAP